MIPMSKGDVPIQHSKDCWQHFCREKNETITLMFFDYCPYCNDPQPMIQKAIDYISAAMLMESAS